MIITLSGSSGSGKSTIAKALCAADDLLVECVSVTTRPRREGEIYRVDYVFVSEQVFFEYDKDNLFFREDKNMMGIFMVH